MDMISSLLQQCLSDTTEQRPEVLHEASLPDQIMLVPTATQAEQWRTFSRWAAAQLAIDPKQRIGLLIPELADSLDAIRIHLARHLHPDQFVCITGEHPPSHPSIEVFSYIDDETSRYDTLWLTEAGLGTWAPLDGRTGILSSTLETVLSFDQRNAATNAKCVATISEWLLTRAPTLILSWQTNTRTPDQPSPLLTPASVSQQHLPIIEAPMPPRQPIGDLNTSETGPTKLSSRALTLQSLCPFRAYAELQLGLRPPAPTPEPFSLCALTRGQIIHAVLANFWRITQTQDALKTMKKIRLTETLRDLCAQSLEDLDAQRGQPLLGPTKDREVDVCVEQLLQPWLELESTREPFQVQHIEFSTQVEVANQNIPIRIDRIDESADGRLLIMDYKTGSVSAHNWMTERLGDAQMPLYALSTQAPIAALAYGVIRPNEHIFSGLQDVAGRLPGIRMRSLGALKDRPEVTWQSLKAQWRTQLEQVAEAYLRSDAYVDPREPGQTCRTCHLHALCRINCS